MHRNGVAVPGGLARSPWITEVDRAVDQGTAIEELASLAKRHVWARWAVASNPACPAELLQSLADDDAPLVRHAVAQNLSTPPEVRSRLAEDPDHRVGMDISKLLL
jgi:hypothetical protein